MNKSCRAIASLLIAGLALVPFAHSVVAQNRGTTPGENGQPTTTRSIDAAKTRAGRYEFVVISPRGQSNAALKALTDAGARLLRWRDYPNLARRALVVDLGQNITLDRARSLTRQAAPLSIVDVNTFYRFADNTPRLYAAKMIGQSSGEHCRLPKRVRIGQIDGPVEVAHPALKHSRIATTSVLLGDEIPPARNHGTSVAALMVGQDSSGALAGFAPGARLFAATAFAREGRSEAADVEKLGAAFDWLVGSNVEIINLSFSGPRNLALEDMLARAAKRRIVLVAAAGNGGIFGPTYPAASRYVIAVTAVDAASRHYKRANTGNHIEFAAPGVDLYVAKRQGGAYASGTSYAAPIITGLAARLIARGTTSLSGIRAHFRGHSVDLGTPGQDKKFGWGLAKAPKC